MSRVLAIESSTNAGSIALEEESTGIRTVADFHAERSTSAQLFAALDGQQEILEGLDRILVGLGPGSYTGIRVAITAAQALALATGVPVYGLPSIAALRVADSRYQVIGDARRQTFYHAIVERGLFVKKPELMSEDELRDLLNRHQDEPVYCTEDLRARFPQAKLVYPHACVLLQLSSEEKITLDYHPKLEPIYLRPPFITQPKRSSATPLSPSPPPA